MADKGWIRQQEVIERANHLKCVENAKKYGFSEEEANNCSIGDEICPKCPFRDGE